MTEKKPADPTKWPWWGVPAVIGALLAGLAYPMTALYFQNDLGKLAQFGDMFGAFNALVSSMGFVGLLISLHMQRQQFQASLADMRDSADASKAEAEAIKMQIQEMKYSSRVARSQNGILIQQAEIQRLSSILATQSELYTVWFVHKRVTAAVGNDNQGNALAASIGKTLTQLQDMQIQKALD